MKKVALMTMCVALALSSCGTYTGTGAYAGATIGSVLGSAIGGISGGWRGSDVGTIIGMAGGAAVGAAVGASADKSAADRRVAYEQRRAERAEQRAEQRQYDNATPDNGGYYDPNNGGDDRIDFEGGNNNAPAPASVAEPIVEKGGLSISNVRFIDGGSNARCIRPGETCKISFELRNTSNNTVYNVRPQVTEVSGNRHITVSQGISVESIAPNSGVRFTAMIKADRQLGNGKAVFRASAYNPADRNSVAVDDIEIETRR